MNALAASAAVMAMGISLSQIKTGLAQLKPVKGRLQPVVSQQGNIVIDDTYNANPSSLKAALAVLQDCPGEHWLALGAFGEMGPDSEAIHRDLAEHIKAFGIKRLFATGAFTETTAAAFGAGAEYFPVQADLITALQQALKPGVSLLVKGSRSQKMENVVLALINSSEK
jgi:UDP-N-acetylmuramoyl-tripeptide--D-alanyl-D-alanine ligase